MDTPAARSELGEGASAMTSPGSQSASQLPTPLLERMALGEVGSDLDSPWWRKFGLGGGPRGSDAEESEEAEREAMVLHEALLEDGRDEQEAAGRRPRKGRREVAVAAARKCACCVMPSVVIALLLSFFVGFLAVVPPMGQTIMDQATLKVVRMHMKNPTPTKLTLNATIELHDVGEVSSRMESSEVEVMHEGEVLATMLLPEMDIVGGEVLRLSMESEMTVRNVSAFTKATAKILQGVGGVWFIRGRPTVKVDLLGLTRSFQVSLFKEFDVPATLLEQVTGYDSQVLPVGATEDSFELSAKTSFFSSSILEMYHLGRFVFDLEVFVDSAGQVLANADTDDEASARRVKLGEVVMADFDLRQGMNVLDVRGTVRKTAANDGVLSQFVSNFMNGIDQRAMIKGPTQAAAPFLDDVVTQSLVFQGMTDQPIDSSYVDKSTINGFSAKPPGFKHPVHYRGTLVIGHNPLDAPVAESNITTQVLLSEPLGYVLDNKMLGRWVCPISRDFAELYSAPGMFEEDASRPPIVHMPPHQRISFFLPGRPRAGQIRQRPCTLVGVPVAGEYDCCMVSVQTAAACRAKKAGANTFDVDITSTFTLHLGPFELPVTSVQQGTPTLFAAEVTDGFLLDAELSCDDITFLN